jgi:5-methylcytosine-specific restriction endonuclease McrA
LQETGRQLQDVRMPDVRTYRTVLPTGQTLWIADLTPEQFVDLVTSAGQAAVVDDALTGAAADLVDPRIGWDMPILRITDAEPQPWECEEGRCDHCGHRMRAQHYHCCGLHLHLTGSGRCYDAHGQEHRSGMRAGRAAPVGQQMAPLLRYSGPVHLAFRRDTCEGCGLWSPAGQGLHVDHHDGDHGNNHPTNLVTLCGRCHHRKSAARGDYQPLAQRPRRR